MLNGNFSNLAKIIILTYIIFSFDYSVVSHSNKPKCNAPIPPIYGTFKEKRNKNIRSDVIQYLCNNGTFLYGSEFRKCLKKGTWNATTPYCATPVIKEIFNKERILQNLTDSNYSTCIKYKDTMDLSFHYNESLFPEGKLRFVWKAKQKKENNKTISGNMRCTALRKYNRDLYGFNEYICNLQINKTHSFNIPAVGSERELCEIEIFTKRDDVCPKLLIKNGRIQYDPPSNIPIYGIAAVIICNEGYNISDEYIRYCSDGGQWLGRNSSCEKVRCKSLSNVENGNITQNDQTYLGIAKLHCDDGYMPIKNTEASCQSDGTWSVHNFSCKLIDCGNHTGVKNGMIEYSNRTLSGVALLQCKTGYDAMYEKNSTCLKNGSWSYSNFECKQIHCYEFPKLKNGVVWLQERGKINNATVGTIARMQCDPGFTKTSGQLYIECLISGKWSKTNVTCKGTTKRSFLIIAAAVGAVSSAIVFACCLVCAVLLRKRLKRRALADASRPLNEIPERRISPEKHEYSAVVYEEIKDVWKKKPTSPLPNIPSNELEFEYSFPIDQRKDSCAYGGSDYNYMEPEDAYKTERVSRQTRPTVKRRNSSADSTYWRENSDFLKDIYASDVPSLRRLGSNTSLPDFPANKFSIFENDLYSSD